MWLLSGASTIQVTMILNNLYTVAHQGIRCHRRCAVSTQIYISAYDGYAHTQDQWELFLDYAQWPLEARMGNTCVRPLSVSLWFLTVPETSQSVWSPVRSWMTIPHSLSAYRTTQMQVTLDTHTYWYWHDFISNRNSCIFTRVHYAQYRNVNLKWIKLVSFGGTGGRILPGTKGSQNVLTCEKKKEFTSSY